VVAERHDGTAETVLRHAYLDVLAVIAELQVGAQAPRFGDALLVVDLEATALPRPARVRVVQIKRAAGEGGGAVVGVLDRGERRGRHDGRRLAEEPAAAPVGLQVELDAVVLAEPEGGTRADVPVLHLIAVGLRLELQLRYHPSGAGAHSVGIDLYG